MCTDAEGISGDSILTLGIFRPAEGKPGLVGRSGIVAVPDGSSGRVPGTAGGLTKGRSLPLEAELLEVEVEVEEDDDVDVSKSFLSFVL
jgi:hypothetical protein